ncbi:efflux transporter outer membrane subunit [Burkholderia sp. BCC1988]|uniref:efflux transporter outer membrane subunit n=1 Tax=Burkholderia sp. BCC1988 TaxID=2817443 RepID=UPI002AAFFB15|nr:efflux transporter outer membrane subunit [Burkholderia sp. BCC1988]
MKLRPFPFRGLNLAGVCAGVLCACTAGPDFHRPDTVADSTYTAAPQPVETVGTDGPGGDTQRFVTAESVGGAWWQAFESDELNRLVEHALDASPTVEQARATLAQAAQDYRAQADGTLWPQIDASLNTTREKLNPAATGIGSVIGNRKIPPFTLYQATISVSYSLDLAGGNRRALEALAAQLDNRRFELDAARLTLAGNVVTTAVHRASLAKQLALTDALLSAQLRQLDIDDERYRTGGISNADLLTQRTLVEQTRATLAPLRAQLAQADHQLAIYLGRTPAQGAGAAPELDALVLPKNVPLVLPSTLARQRPDIRASEALLHQASANVGVATANLYPKINLTASMGPEGTGLSDLLNVWSLGAGLTQPIFHGGQLRARKRSAEQAYAAAAAAYRQTVLQGLQQVADALRALDGDAQELASRDRAQRDAEAALQITRRRFDAGGVSEYAVLDSQRQALQTTLDRTRVQAQRMTDTAALFQALGGTI